MTDIANLKIYNERMKKSLIDKVFWLDRIDPDVIVDFGCGDGTLLEFVNRNFPNILCLGYDTSEEMIELAKKKQEDTLLFYRDYDYLRGVLGELWDQGKKIALILNSVIHEVYSYGTEDSIKEFWERVNDPIFKWICIRDMAVSSDLYGHNCSPEDLEKILSHPVYGKAALEFKEVWGSLAPLKNHIHFLLKYKYQENWERELHENYLPISQTEIFNKILGYSDRAGDYDLIYDNDFCLDYIRRQVKEDFSIDLKHNTHIKMIFERT